jgi:hypothetical protein
MNPKRPAVEGCPSASELRKLSPSEQDAILAKAAAFAEQAYRTNARLTDFAAFGEDALHGESTSTPADRE